MSSFPYFFLTTNKYSMSIRSVYLSLLLLLFIPNFIQAQINWKNSKAGKTNLQAVEFESLPTNFRLLELNQVELQTTFNSISKSNKCIDIPMPDGSEECFVLEESDLVHKSLASQRPDIKTFRGSGLYNPKASVQLVYTDNNFHLIGDSDQGSFFIDKVTRDDQAFLISYYAKDEVRQPIQCKTEIDPNKIENNLSKNNFAGTSWGTELRKYRMAIMWTSGHSASYNHDTTAMIDRNIEIVADMNFVCERDLSVTFELAINPDSLIFSDPATDPYDGLGSITGTINDRIGSENYEIGFAVNGGGGGVSYVGVTCGGAKAGSQCSNDHWTIVHELGHNMGAGHMMNYCPDWGGNNMEPGAGNSIMSYGGSGVCGGGHQVPDGRIDYFHGRSIEQMYNTLFLNTNCAENIATNNNPPIATVPSGGFYIPKSTPFSLEGSATDPDGTTDFTYSWQQFDSGIGSPPWAPTEVDPLFQLLPHDISPVRTIPKLASIINGYNYGEVLPEVSRTLNFRFYVRDNHTIGKGITFEELQFFVEGNAGPFVVNYPNDDNVVIAEEQTITVTWDVANTDQSPINSTLVDILLSTDGGYTYPITLASSVSNDGSEEITIPANSIGTTNRIKVASADNIFFDISDEDFSIVAADTNDFIAFSESSALSVCSENTLDYQINIAPIGTFTGTLDLSISGLPAGVTSNIPSTVLSSGIFTLSLGNLNAVAAGNYPMVLTLTETGGTVVKTIDLNFLKKENLMTSTPDKAISFDGNSNVHISKSNPDFDFNDDKDFSIELWIKTTSTSGDAAIISDKNWHSGSYKGWVIAMASGTLIFNAGSGSNRIDLGSNGVTYNDNQWHHIAVSFSREGQGLVQLYADGVLLNEKIPFGLENITQSNDVVIGADTNNNYSYDGLVDEVRIWSKALTATEIREGMHRTLENCTTDLISCFQFNEASGDVLDAFSMHHGILSNATRVISSAPLGTGTANTQIENATNVTYTTTNFEANYSNQVEASVTATKINLAPNSTEGIDAADLVFNNQYWVLNRFENSGDLSFDATFSVNETITSQEVNNPISLKLYGRNFNADGEWTFLTYGANADALTNSVTFNNISTYGQYLITKNTTPVIAIFTEQLAFCKLGFGTSSEVLVYELSGAYLTNEITLTAPSGFQISTEETTGFDNAITLTPTGGALSATIYVRFTPNTAGDFTGDISHSSLGANSPLINLTGTSVFPQASNALSFDGSANVHIPKTTSDFDFGDDKNFSIEFWTKTTTTSGDDAIISDKDWDSGSYAGWVVAMQSGQFVFNAGSGGDRVDIGSGSVDYNDNEWHHVAVSFNRIADLLEIYVDGHLKNSKSLGSLGNINTTHDIVIGADTYNAWEYEGQVEDIRIWSKALSATEIREGMHLIYTGCKENLIASYHLDETSAEVFDDLGVHNGIINNAVSMTSTAPIGPGTANSQIEVNGIVDFLNTKFFANYSAHTGAAITTTQLTVSPNGIDGIDPNDVAIENQYWILNDYENTGNLTFEATFTIEEGISAAQANNPSSYKLYGRDFNSDTEWTLITSGSTANATSNKVGFSGVQQYGQYLITSNPTLLDLCDPPINISSTIISGNVVKLLWDVVDASNRYRIRYRPIGGTWTELLTANIETFRFINGLTPNTTYQYQVKSLCSTENSIWSATYEFTTISDICDFPTTSEATNTTNSSSTISWDVDPGDLKYKFKYRGIDFANPWTEYILTVSSKDISGLLANQNYKYKLKAKCANGWTNWSPNFFFSTLNTIQDESLLRNSESNLNNDLSISPNPAKDVLNLVFAANEKNITINVYNILGDLIISQRAIAGTTSAQLSITNLHTGNYFIMLQNGEEQLVQKFVKY